MYVAARRMAVVVVVLVLSALVPMGSVSNKQDLVSARGVRVFVIVGMQTVLIAMVYQHAPTALIIVYHTVIVG